MMENIKPREPDFKQHEIHVRFKTVHDLTQGNDQEEEDIALVSMSFYLIDDYHEMKRDRNEEMSKSIQRLARHCFVKHDKLNKPKKKRSKIDKDAAVAPEEEQKAFPVDKVISGTFISLDGKTIDLTSLTNEHYQNGMIIHIPITETVQLKYSILVNPPTILQLQTYPKTSFVVNCPILSFVSFDEKSSDYECLWYVESSPNSGEYRFSSNDKIFVPKEESAGCKIKLFANAVAFSSSSEGKEKEIFRGRSYVHYLHGVITPLPRKDQLLSRLNEVRKDYHSIPSYSNYDLRIVSYNVLSEEYAQRENAGEVMYSYCSPAYLETEYRIQRIGMELLACSGDIIGLQECDYKVFHEYLQPLLETRDYVGFYTNKISSVREGCALFIKKTHLEVLQFLEIPIKNHLLDAPYLAPLYAVRPDLRDVIGNRLGTIVQIIILKDTRKEDQILVVANTHLYYHPLCAYIRLLQMHFILKTITEIVQQVSSGQTHSTEEDLAKALDKSLKINEEKEKSPMENLRFKCKRDSKVSVILQGDLNSTPGVVTLEYLENGQLNPLVLSDAWERLSFYRWSTSAETAEESQEVDRLLKSSFQKKKLDFHGQGSGSIELPTGPLEMNLFRHPLNLENTSKDIPYTNYVPVFKELLDYIFISKDHFEVVTLAPMPTAEELEEETALPSSVFPSDHLSIAIDVKYKQ
jgi:mRNA deadenylase 3'-5' endonuclease subunit Ccr4